MYLIKTRDDDILNLETGDLYHLEKNLLPENCHVKKNDELAVSGGAACLRLWEHLLSLLKFDATKAQDAPQGRTNIRQHADTCQRRIVEIREVDPKGQNLIDELIHLEAYRDGLLTALEYIDDATQAQAGPRKFKTGDTVIITGTSNAANIGKRGTVKVLDEIFNEVLLEGSTLRVFYEDKDLTSAD